MLRVVPLRDEDGRGIFPTMRTRGELIFVEVAAAIGAVAFGIALTWVAYWLLDNAGMPTFFAFCFGGALAFLAIGISVDIRKKRYRFRDLPGALFRPVKH